MHAIESLVECSVKIVATISPVPPLARNICFSLYKLQSQLDCGYTVLRVRDELEKLGYLFLLPPEQLPEPERSAAMKFAKEGGFLDDGTYFDCHSGCCCITAGSELWKKLIDQGILPASAKTEMRELDPIELAELITPLASKVLAGGDETGADTLGLWYTFFPLLCIVAGIDDDNTPEPERIQALLKQLAVPKVFEVMEYYGEDIDLEAYDEEGISFLSGWEKPYNDWKKKKKECLSSEFCRRMVYDYISKNDFVEADSYAVHLKDGADFDRLFHRCLIALSCCSWLNTKGEELILPEHLLPLEEVETGFKKLSELSLPRGQEILSPIFLARTQFLLGKISAAVDTVKVMYNGVLSQLDQRPDGNEKQLQHASITANYYQMMNDNIPNEYPGKKELMITSIPGMLDLHIAREVLCRHLPLMPQMAEDLQCNIDSCDKVIQQIQELTD